MDNGDEVNKTDYTKKLSILDTFKRWWSPNKKYIKNWHNRCWQCLTKCGHNIDTMLTKCWHSVEKNITTMLIKHWQYIDTMPTQCWHNVNTMLTRFWHNVDKKFTMLTMITISYDFVEAIWSDSNIWHLLTKSRKPYWLTPDSPIWIREMLAHLKIRRKRFAEKNLFNTLGATEFYASWSNGDHSKISFLLKIKLLLQKNCRKIIMFHPLTSSQSVCAQKALTTISSLQPSQTLSTYEVARSIIGWL